MIVLKCAETEHQRSGVWFLANSSALDVDET